MIVGANRAGEEQAVVEADLLLNVISDVVVLREAVGPDVSAAVPISVTSAAPSPSPVALICSKRLEMTCDPNDVVDLTEG